MNGPYRLAVDLVDFFKTGKVAGSIANAANMVGEHTLRVIAINLLPWIKRGLKPNQEPLQLMQEYPWCLELTRLINEDSFFRALLVVDDGSVSLNPAISQEEVNKIRELCFAAYNPPLMR